MSDFSTWVTARRQRAAAAMAELSGNASACAMGRAGRSFPAFKYHEGATASLGALTRALRRGEGERGSVEKLLGEWQTPGGVGRDWEAYTAGGREALEEAREQLDAR
ncbi:hypothetical protein B842_02285 [Corynebacterium humireducens NBRC 106098 = DSM 45392]|uniref:Uncharacterized protein n=1 Tax=Corynebacterium humireducens NBRC 106098 = DSM 45392 TaxID=1223515 RepID=A0A0B5D0H9_9CORY|nr:hypothetical protein [Corynebacterium humireducens]AJE32310.1 hypothetical protein B842_02285 [Corynebacterium humireducens NBRC 106098 = DSM 45392]